MTKPLYLSEIGQYGILSREVEESLYPKLIMGCVASQQKLVESNLRIAIKVANRYHRKYPHFEYEELISEANVGLSSAIQKFNPSLGYRFSTYAEHWIKKYLEMYCVMNNYHVRVTPDIHYAAMRFYAYLNEQELTVSKLSTSQFNNIQKELNISSNKLRFIIQHLNQPRYENNNHLIDNDNSLMDSDNDMLWSKTDPALVTSEDIIESIEQERREQSIGAALTSLSESEERILSASFGLHGDEALSHEEIAENLHITKYQVRSIKRKAIAQLKADIENQIGIKIL